MQLRTHEAATAEANRLAALNAGEDTRLRAYYGVATTCLMSMDQVIVESHPAEWDELNEWLEQNRRLGGSLLNGIAEFTPLI